MPLIPIKKLIWDSTAFDNQYSDIMPLVESIREHGIYEVTLAKPMVFLIASYRMYLVVTGRKITRAAAMLGKSEINCDIVNYWDDIAQYRIKETSWQSGQQEGRNYGIRREGY